jgi:Zn-finger protein
MENYKKITHTSCEYFPCHTGVKAKDFNCLFCYCPLYALKEACGGDYSYTKTGIKNCMACTKPHDDMSYDYVMSKMDLLMKLASNESHK